MGAITARVGLLQPLAERSPAAWHNAVAQAVENLHASHAWKLRGRKQRVSFGLVRVARVATAIQTARELCKRFPHARIACYHSRDFLIQRTLKEERLDKLLTRKDGNVSIERDKSLGRLLDDLQLPDIPFIVVATPVEEVGRDHDFDWAVIEPSSTRSIVQTSGRVNRHRNQRVNCPNIAVLQYNFVFSDRQTNQIAFYRPGYETSDRPFRTHDLAELLVWKESLAIDARLFFDEQNLFPRLDAESIDAVLRKPLGRFFDARREQPHWVVQSTYSDYPLREESRDWNYYLDSDGKFRLLEVNERGKQISMVREPAREIARAPNDWLTWSAEELLEECRNRNLKREQGMYFGVLGRDNEPTFEVDWSFGMR